MKNYCNRQRKLNWFVEKQFLLDESNYPSYYIPLLIKNKLLTKQQLENIAKKKNLFVNNLVPYEYLIANINCNKNIRLIVKKCLIPREDSLIPLKAVIKACQTNSFYPTTILDVGTGTGYLLQYLAKIYPKCLYYGIDVNKDAINIAKKNCKLNHTKIEFKQTSFIKFFQNNNTSYDIIVANLPYLNYIDQNLMWEPPSSLFSSTAGLYEYMLLLKCIKQKCFTNIIALEINYQVANKLMLFAKNLFINYKIIMLKNNSKKINFLILINHDFKLLPRRNY